MKGRDEFIMYRVVCRELIEGKEYLINRYTAFNMKTAKECAFDDKDTVFIIKELSNGKRIIKFGFNKYGMMWKRTKSGKFRFAL